MTEAQRIKRRNSNKLWRIKNLEKERARCRAYRAAHLEKRRASWRAWHKKNKTRRQQWACEYRSRNFGTIREQGWARIGLTATWEQFQELIKQQNNRCSICNVEMTHGKRNDRFKANLDHDHNTGQLRGVLCNECNKAIGILQEKIESLEKAIAYLRYWNTTNS